MNQTVSMNIVELISGSKPAANKPQKADPGQFQSLLEKASQPKASAKGMEEREKQPLDLQGNGQEEDTKASVPQEQLAMAQSLAAAYIPDVMIPTQETVATATATGIQGLEGMAAPDAGILTYVAEHEILPQNPLEQAPVQLDGRPGQIIVSAQSVVHDSPEQQSSRIDTFNQIIQKAATGLGQRPNVTSEPAPDQSGLEGAVQKAIAGLQGEAVVPTVTQQAGTGEGGQQATTGQNLKQGNSTAKEAPSIRTQPLQDESTVSSSIAAAIQKLPTIEAEPMAPIAAPSPVQPSPQLEQIKAAVEKQIESGRMEFQMQLNPRDLGKIDVKMVLQDGKLSVEIAASNPKTQQMLRTQSEQLGMVLKTATTQELATVQVVNRHGEAASANPYGMNNGQQQDQHNRGQQEQQPRFYTANGIHFSDETDDILIVPQQMLDYAV